MSPRVFAFRDCDSFYHQIRLMAERGLPERGVTLVELLTTLTAASIILLIMGKFLADFHESREVARVMMEMQEQAQFAMDYMTYGFVDPATSGAGDVRRSNGLIWASSYTIENNGKCISFTDSANASIMYEERDNRLVHYLRADGSGNGKVIIPYLDGSEEYHKRPFEVSVNFRQDPNQLDHPDRSVVIDLTVSKDGLTSSLKSTVALRNWRSAQ